ncbi:uncharacterized protein TNCV_3450831 [Trichonephila clavipes]|uniref:Integrase catalytic domain-containing protein n=1 Tax=Trichonephila clavipes TaxID=2585209 RepID=A0A8X6WK35_TRICX|nr:uncharacterized protein TNCV_3450831 [Trichonephila clavipes]
MQMERVNQTLVAKLRCKVNSTTKIPWTKLIEQVTNEYNNSPHDVTGFPPAYLMFGTLPYDSPLPNQVKLNYPPIQQARQIAVNRTTKHHKINKQRGKQGELLERIDRQNSRFRTAKTTIIKFGLHASFVELESTKSAVNEYFVDGLKDGEIQKAVRMADVQNLKSALLYALKLEAATQASRRDRQSVRGARVTTDAPCESAWRKEIEKLREETQDLMA